MITKWDLPSSSSKCILETYPNYTFTQTYNKNLKYASLSVNFLGGDILEKILHLKRGFLHLFEHIVGSHYMFYFDNNLLEGDLNTPPNYISFRTSHTSFSIQVFTHHSNIKNAIKVFHNVLAFDINEDLFEKIKKIEIKRITTELKTQNRELREKLIIFSDLINDPQIDIAEDMVLGKEADLETFNYTDFIIIKDALINQVPKNISLQSNKKLNSKEVDKLKMLSTNFIVNKNLGTKAKALIEEIYSDVIENKIYNFKSTQNKLSLGLIYRYPFNNDYKEVFLKISKMRMLREILASFIKENNIGNYAVQTDSTNIYYKYEVSLLDISNSVLTDEETRTLLETKFFHDHDFINKWSTSKDIITKFQKLKSVYLFDTDSYIDPQYTNNLSFPLLLGVTPFTDSLMNHIDYIKSVKLHDVLIELKKFLEESSRVYIKTTK